MYKVEIDFDEASKAWRQNKIQVGNGMFKYCCGVSKQNGSICKVLCKGEWSNCDFHKANIYEVENILNHKYVKKNMIYLVKWKNYSHRESTWEPESNFLGENAVILLSTYKQTFGIK